MSVPQPFQPAPCRYCGEAEWLTFLPEFVDDHYAHEADGSLVMDGDTPKLHYVDHIECDMCGAIAPEHVWNGAPVTPAMRAALAAEYRRQGAEPMVASRGGTRPRDLPPAAVA